MTLHFDPPQLPSGEDPSTINRYYYAKGAWQSVLPCSGCSLNLTNDTITVKLGRWLDE
ncbi:hypothetical protein GCM10010160_40920 [Acrocarpospora corrugata]